MFNRQLKSFTKIVRFKKGGEPYEVPIESGKTITGKYKPPKGDEPKWEPAKAGLTESHVREVERRMGLKVGAISEYKQQIMAVMEQPYGKSKLPPHWHVKVSPDEPAKVAKLERGSLGWDDADFRKWETALDQIH